MPVGSHIMGDVIFTPPGAGDYSVYLGILSNDAFPPPGPQTYLLLQGTGVPPAIPAPGAALLVALGIGLVARFRRRLGI